MHRWNDFDINIKIIFFIVTFIIGWFIRQADPTGGVLMSLFYILISLLIFKKDEWPQALGHKKPESGAKSYLYALLAVGVFIGIFFPFYILSPFCPMHLFDPLIQQMYPLVNNIWLFIIIFYLMIGTFTVYAEEVYFRGFLQDSLDDMLGIRDYNDPTKLTKKRLGSLTIVSLLFGISHLNLLWARFFLWFDVVPNFIFITIGMISLSGVGFLFGLLRIKFDSLIPALVAHTIGNFFMVIIPSLIVLQFPSLLLY